MANASAYKMISIPEAQAIVLEHTPVLPAETVSLHLALDRVLAETVTARDPLPPFPASIKDGYAVVAADGPGEYDVVGESRAGALDPITVAPGTVAYITTGAPVPPGADAVVQVEDTAAAEGAAAAGGRKRIKICKAAKPGQDIRPVGSDISAGQVVLAAGETVGPAEVGILATVGAAHVAVRRTPFIAVLSTGDEVVEPGATPGPGQIRDANRSMLLAAGGQTGARVVDLGIARDVDGHLDACIDKAIAQGVDVLVTSGGVSMGDRDLLKPLLARKGAVHFGRVRMKPGKPLTFATLDVPAVAADGSSSGGGGSSSGGGGSSSGGGGSSSGGGSSRRLLVFGLPGNPVSSFVCFNLVVVPCLRRMAGWAEPHLRRVHARLTCELKMDPERPEYHRASLIWAPSADGGQSAYEFVAESTGNQISSRLLSARSANALLEIPQDEGVLPAGTVVSALLIDDCGKMTVGAGERAPRPTPGFA